MPHVLKPEKADADGWYFLYGHTKGVPRPPEFHRPGIVWHREDGRIWVVDAVFAWREAGYMAKPDFATKRPLDIGVSRETYLKERLPRFGRRNPERIEAEFWKHMIRSEWHPHQAREYFDLVDTANHQCPLPGVERHPGAMFCFQRLGQSRTTLADGRVVCVGGEYDDSYDPDFHIYNDVVVLGPDGAIEIYGYPSKVFPPTDFHTATLIGDRLYLIGGLGYTEDWKPEPTRVRALDLKTFRMESVASSGDDPGWLFHHEAEPSADGGSIVVRGGVVKAEPGGKRRDNFDEFSLDVRTGAWRKLTDRRWTQHRVAFVDRKVDVHLIEKKDANGRRLYKFLQDFLPFPSNEVLKDGEKDYSKRVAVVDGVPLLAESDRGGVKLTVKGELPPERVEELLAGIGRLLEEHAGSPVTTERLR